MSSSLPQANTSLIASSSQGNQTLEVLNESGLAFPSVSYETLLHCHDEAWELLPWSELSTQLADRRQAIRNGLTPSPVPREKIEYALDKADHISPLSLRESVQAFFTWDLHQHPTTPHLFPRKLTSDDTLCQVNSLERISHLAKHLLTTGHLPVQLNCEAAGFMLLDLSRRSPISIASPLIGGSVTTLATLVHSPYLAAATAIATGIAVAKSLSASTTRNKYNLGYLTEVVDTERSLEKGEVPTIEESLKQLVCIEPSSETKHLRAEGFLMARALRLMEVPSKIIHEAFTLNTATDMSNQCLLLTLKAKLKEQHLDFSGSLVDDYEASRGTPEGLAATLSALQKCYFSWGNTMRHELQGKMHDLVLALPT